MTRPGGRRLASAGAVIALVAWLGAQAGYGQQQVPVPAPAVITQLGVAGVDPAAFASARAAGARSVRILADWSVIEPVRGQWLWADLDRAVASAVRDGLTPVVVLAHTPRWASIGAGADLTRPEIYSRQPAREIPDWERFVRAVAGRHRGRVADWQVWTQLGLPSFRGTGSEYLTMLRAARAVLRDTDPACRVAMATPGGVDLGFIVGVAREAPTAFDAVTVVPQGLAPENLLRPLAVLAQRLKPAGKTVWLDWTAEGVVAEEQAGVWARALAVAQAGGVERVFLSGVAQMGPGFRQAAAVTLSRPFAGYLVRDPDVYAVVIGSGAEATILAWATADGRTLDVSGAQRLVGLDGRPVASDLREGRLLIRLGSVPVTVAGLPGPVVDEARATAAARGPMLPVVSPDRDFSRAPEVSARLGRQSDERGLYNQPFRSRRNGAVEPVERGGVEAVQTSVARQVIYVYFDLDDTFLYFAEGRVPVDVTVEVWGAEAPRQVGFNLLYDSTGGYRFTPWQWVDVRDGWVTYTVRLGDANMANTWGWDLAINTAGNRAADLVIRSVTVRKIVP